MAVPPTTKKQIAQLVVNISRGEDTTAAEVATMQSAWAIYECLREHGESDIELTEQEADAVLQQLPTSFENEQSGEGVASVVSTGEN